MVIPGDSFWWNIALQVPLGEIFSAAPYWYYNSTVHYYPPYEKVENLDLKNELLSSDFVMLFYSASTQYRMNDGFTQKALEALGQIPDDVAFDTTAFLENEIQRNIAKLLANPQSMDMIREKSERNGISLDEQLRADAEWVVNYQIDHGILSWPKRKKETTTNSEDNGIQ